ncbi:hypothetical protein [Methylomicrobium sp. Wu6]|uniref:hypothetical protein n=1 Tax=Methylomicrobium sp. Wu6 TaxID=3107928 RepID=UPI002DD6607A|nr:hypothetical protein [Methylomicrobium sp. Wu6]MEC4749584.1 hypothetical protein [Methylomicrobium sp. Wu6]
MPGIVGIFGRDINKESSSTLTKMLESMVHETFYTSGSYTNEQLHLSVGWVNHKDSFSDCLPIWNKTKDICLIFSGEDFSDERFSPTRNQSFEGSFHLNANYLLDLYEVHGEKMMPLLNGWFCGVIIDLKTNRSLLFNDRYGMQRLYIFASKDIIYFASEAKALLAVCPELRRFDYKSLGEFFSFGCALENRSLFANVTLLPPASIWTLDQERKINKKFYFKPETWEGQNQLEPDEFYKVFRETFIKILPRYLEPSNQIAMSLTGGLDTRMILANLKLAPDILPGYSFGGMYNECYDVKISRKIAKVINQPHQVFEVGKQFLSQFPELANKTVYITDGGLDVTGAADLYVNQLARNIAPIRLTGNYGSEILRGARHLKAVAPCHGLFEPSFEKDIMLASHTLDSNWHGHPVSLAAFKQSPWHHFNRFGLEQSQLRLRSPYLDNELVKLMFQAPIEVLRSSELSFRLINDGNPLLGRMMTDRGLLSREQSNLSTHLIHFYREFLFKADYAFNYGMPKWLSTLDYYVFAPLHFEQLFLGRHKFHHFRVWFRDELSSYIKEILLDDRSLSRSYINRQFMADIVTDHTKGRVNYTTEITKLLSLELLQRSMFDK